MIFALRRLAAFCVAVLIALPPALSQQKSPSSEADRQRELDAAIEAALKAAKPGPSEIRLGEQGKIGLPQGYQYVPVAESERLMRAFGNRTGPSFLGLILSSTGDNWMTVIDFNKAGYVKDDDAKNWKADELLQNLKDGTEAGNADRRERGFREIEVAGWVEPPKYDEATKRLVWSALVRGKGASAGDAQSVNYNTYALGREGYYQLNLITGSDRIEAEKKHAYALLAALAYDDGKRYQDFNPSTDHVAEYSLAALVAGAAAKKLGLFAMIGVFLAKFWKVGLIAIAALGALVPKLLRRRG